MKNRNKTWKVFLIIMAIVAAIAGVICAAVFLIIPETKYRQAEKLLESDEYEEASAAFEELGSYKDAAERIKEPFYVEGQALLSEGKYTKAINAFTQADGFSDAETQIEEARYCIAGQLYDKGKFDEAYEAYNHLEDYKDSMQKARQIRLYQAQKAFNEEDYELAAEYYSSIAEQEEFYTRARRLIRTGQYDDASVAFSILGNYKDSEQLVTGVYYYKAEDLFEKGKYDQAAAFFEKAGDYKNARERVLESYYEKGEAALEQGNLSAAVRAFTKAEGYLNAGERAQEIQEIIDNQKELPEEITTDDEAEVRVSIGGMLTGQKRPTEKTDTASEKPVSKGYVTALYPDGKDVSYKPASYNKAAPDWTEYTDLIAKIKAEMDLETRSALMHKAEDILMGTGAIIPLYYYNDIYLQKSDVFGIYSNLFGFKYFQFACTPRDVLKVNLGGEPGTLDPAFASSVEDMSMDVNLFAGLYIYDEEGSLQPDLCDPKKPYEVSKDGLVYTFHLQDGLKWSKLLPFVGNQSDC